LNLDTNTILIVAGVIAALVILILLLRPRRQRPTIERRAEGEGPYVASSERPYVRASDPQPPPQRQDGPQGNGIADEVATATTDVTGSVLGVGAREHLPGAVANPDDLTLLKGVGPKFASRLNELGIGRYEQLAGLSENEVAMLDEKLGPFRGRLIRDRVIDQACFLARGDKDGFEAHFGKLGGTGGGEGMPTIRG